MSEADLHDETVTVEHQAEARLRRRQSASPCSGACRKLALTALDVSACGVSPQREHGRHEVEPPVPLQCLECANALALGF